MNAATAAAKQKNRVYKEKFELIGRKIVRWICVGLAVLVALAAAWLIWLGISKGSEEDQTQQPPVTQGDPAAPQEQEQPENPAEQEPAQSEQTPDQTEDAPQSGETEEPEPGQEPSEDETTEDETVLEEPVRGENEGPIV